MRHQKRQGRESVLTNTYPVIVISKYRCAFGKIYKSISMNWVPQRLKPSAVCIFYKRWGVAFPGIRPVDHDQAVIGQGACGLPRRTLARSAPALRKHGMSAINTRSNVHNVSPRQSSRYEVSRGRLASSARLRPQPSELSRPVRESFATVFPVANMLGFVAVCTCWSG